MPLDLIELDEMRKDEKKMKGEDTKGKKEIKVRNHQKVELIESQEKKVRQKRQEEKEKRKEKKRKRKA